MFRTLARKLTLAFLLVAVTVALLVAISIRFSSSGNFDRFIIEQERSQFETTLAAYYQANGSWHGVQQYLEQYYGGPAPQPGNYPGPGDGNSPPDSRRERHNLFGLVDAQGVVVLPLLPTFPAGTRVTGDVLARGEPVEVDGKVVGTILTTTRPPGLSPEEIAFLRRANNALLLATGGAMLVALVVGVLLARTLTRPLRALTEATHRMAGGALEQEVPVKSKDEIGELASAFNQMSRALARANNARRQMTADVAHELRTPLTVIAGYIESMRDGTLKPTPERLAVIYSEVEHLQDLVGDLRVLSQADAGELRLNKQPLSPHELLQQAQAAFEHQAAQKGVRLELKVAEGMSPITADETRLTQVLANLISNALRFTPEGGTIELGGGMDGGRIVFTVRDTGPGIAPDMLPFIFDRFYRADKSRAQETDESGLGLAIAKAIVEAHGGTIKAESKPGAGTTLFAHFPA
jgi:signal transduction histidine kinase